MASRDMGRTAIDIVLLLLAVSSLCFGVYGGFVLYSLRNDTANLPQPHVATEDELGAAKLAQHKMLDELRREAQLYRGQVPAALVDPAVRPFEQPTPLRKNARRRMPARARNAPSVTTIPRTPIDVSDKIANLRSEMRDFVSKITTTEGANQLIFRHLANEVATGQVEQRNISSRIAVMEAAIKLLQEKGPLFWMGVFATIVTALHHLLSILKMTRENWRKETIAAAAT